METNPNIKFMLCEAQACRANPDELFERLLKLGVPPEIAVWFVKFCLVHLGRIVVLELIRFLQEHPGLFIGAAIGAAVGYLTVHVPLIGPHLAPLVAMVGAIYGAAVGHGVDSDRTNEHFVVLAWQAARIFFQFLVNLLKTISRTDLKQANE
jgi:hypothetical protein